MNQQPLQPNKKLSSGEVVRCCQAHTGNGLQCSFRAAFPRGSAARWCRHHRNHPRRWKPHRVTV